MGTLEAHSGNSKKAKRLLRTSLREPSENAIAQAAWLGRNLVGVNVIEGDDCTSSFEANAWLASQAGEWEITLDQARRWQFDQLFSSRPAILGSFIASRTLEKHEDAIGFAKLGLLSNPTDFMLTNNLAFSLGQLGRAAEAKKVLAKLNPASLNPTDQMFLQATTGLIAFREGHLELGRKQYLEAISSASRLKDPRSAIAMIYLAFEELRAKTPDAESFRERALATGKQLYRPEDRLLVERLQAFGKPEAAKPAPKSPVTDSPPSGLLSRKK